MFSLLRDHYKERGAGPCGLRC